jgi:hypothetical protein
MKTPFRQGRHDEGKQFPPGLHDSVLYRHFPDRTLTRQQKTSGAGTDSPFWQAATDKLFLQAAPFVNLSPAEETA